MPPFRELNDAQLAKLDDDELIEQIRRAREAGRSDAAELAAKVLAFGYSERVANFVRIRLQSKGAVVYEEVAERSLHDALLAATEFRGEKLPEFGGLVFRIAHRRIADYLRRNRIDADPLFYVDRSGELREREKPVADRADEIAELEVKVAAFTSCLDDLNEVHRQVVHLVRFHGLRHAEVAERINGQFEGRLNDPMSEQNVSQIDSRFGKCLERALDEAEGAGPDDD